MANGEGGWHAVVETIKELGPVGWFMLGAGSVLAAIKRGFLIFGEKAELAKRIGQYEIRVEHLASELAERTAERDKALSLIDEMRTSPPKE